MPFHRTGAQPFRMSPASTVDPFGIFPTRSLLVLAAARMFSAPPSVRTVMILMVLSSSWPSPTCFIQP